MKTKLWAAVLLVLLAAPVMAQEDAEGCKDHPLFNRLKGYQIGDCLNKEFDGFAFPVGHVPGADPIYKLESVEGRYTHLIYHVIEGQTRASPLQVMRNFQNAVKAAGGSVLGDYAHGIGDDRTVFNIDMSALGGGHRGTTLKLVKGGREAWALVRAEEDGPYMLTIVERETMSQDIVANELLDKINKDGYVALYINFDTGKASIKPDSMTTLEQVAQMLKAAPDLKLEVAGHTDNVGKPDANLKLSAARAESVIQNLSGRGIAAGRLTPKGYGDTKPVADNRGEEGRAKNRRVELVKK